jgi:23S rRNA (cytidine1920-2'-O)/16S rRNA (cytidine1409-2'-O)-methyltransferase
MPGKKRLDMLLVEKGLVQSRQRARALIMAGKVLVDTLVVDKPGAQVAIESELRVKGEALPYVSRGGLKLAAALAAVNLSPKDRICMDVGASTGGFTDCLLQQGAAKVYAVDVGYGQLAWKLRNDHRVVAIERTNIRRMDKERIADPIDIVTIDTSFISLKIVVPSVMKFLAPKASILALIKPQFEAGKGHVGKGGVVRDAGLRNAVILELTQFFASMELDCGRVIPSPILGAKGNQEYLIHLSKGVSGL